MDVDTEQLLSWLRSAVAERRLTQAEIAQATGVDQSQISRILGGRYKRNSANVTELCAFARRGIQASLEATAGDIETEAQQLLRQLMDGSDYERRLVIEILRHFKALIDARDFGH